jgi:hypothetical protein
MIRSLYGESSNLRAFSEYTNSESALAGLICSGYLKQN